MCEGTRPSPGTCTNYCGMALLMLKMLLSRHGCSSGLWDHGRGCGLAQGFLKETLMFSPQQVIQMNGYREQEGFLALSQGWTELNKCFLPVFTVLKIPLPNNHGVYSSLLCYTLVPSHVPGHVPFLETLALEGYPGFPSGFSFPRVLGTPRVTHRLGSVTIWNKQTKLSRSFICTFPWQVEGKLLSPCVLSKDTHTFLSLINLNAENRATSPPSPDLARMALL